MDTMKRCPNCGQMVRREALKCRYCGHWFEASSTNTDGPAQSTASTGGAAQGGAGYGGSAQSGQAQGGANDGGSSQGGTDYGRSNRAYDTGGSQAAGSQYDNRGGGYAMPEVSPYEPSLLTVGGALSEGFNIGIKNALSLFLAYILYILTIWIPYLNVGTTIGMVNLPITLARNSDTVISPLSIFDGRYRKYMGEFFIILGLMFISLLMAFLFGIIPAIVISYGWSQAIYLMFDKEYSPMDALMQSTKITYGYKWTLFFIDLLIGIIAMVGSGIIVYIISLVIESSVVSGILSIIIIAVLMVWKVGVSAVIYRQLSQRAE